MIANFNGGHRMGKKINILDKGYVRYIKHWGSDIDIVNAARVSFDKEVNVMTEQDSKLIHYLLKNEHISPFRHSGITFEVYAPMMVKNQWIKHQVASIHKEAQDGWNESSRRYVTEIPEFYIPKWRLAPDNMKQGSGEFLEDKIILDELNQRLEDFVTSGLQLYEDAMQAGVAAEQARAFLPAYNMYIRWRWTVSVDAIINFLRLRLHEHSQYEIREYAKAVYSIFEPLFPATADALNTVFNNE